MRRRLIVSALRAGRYEMAAKVLGRRDPFKQTALMRAIDLVVTAARWDDLPRLAPLARRAPPYAARIWWAMSLWHTSRPQAEDAFARLGSDHGEHGFNRMGARAWAMFLSLPRACDTVTKSGQSPSVFQFWDAAPPPEIATEMAVWQNATPLGYVAYDLETAAAYIAAHAGQAEATLFRNAPHAAIQSDYFRLCRIMAEGGMYVDADGRMQPDHAAFRADISGQTAIWFRTRETALSIANCLISAPPAAPLITHAFEEAGRRLADPTPRHVFEYAGPTLLTQTALRLHEEGALGPVVTLTDDEVSRRAMTQIDAPYKKDTRNWRIWQDQRP
ncbi:MAG: hypothetical protein ACPGVA_13355 [Pikeienuella sp.]